MTRKQVTIGILGFGTVGSGIFRILEGISKEIALREGVELKIGKVLVKELDEPNTALVDDKSVFTTSFDDVVNDPDISIVAECMGGVEPARTFILKSLEKGRSVITSNKEVFSKHWPEMEKVARETGAGLYFEATVGGGIPVIRTLTHSMQGNMITNIMGIINGTTNYILTQMSEQGREFGEVLKEAQAKGYAEFDPTADVEGYDAMYKISILASLAFHERVPIERVYREGITRITPEDIKFARELGYTIKLLAIARRENGVIQVRVHPTMIPHNHPLASVRGAFNAVFIHGHAVDDIMLYGRGAGTMPTASAMVSDIVVAATTPEHLYPTLGNGHEPQFAEDWESAFFVRLAVKDKPGVLAKIASVFGQHGVSLASVYQQQYNGPGAHLVFITHSTNEKPFKEALVAIDQLDVVFEQISCIRVERGKE